MKPKQFAQTLKVALENNFNVLVAGRPGIGKTDLINSVTKEIDYDMVTELACLSDPIDYKGLPSMIDGKALFAPFGNLLKLINATEPLVCFFDDIGWAPPSVQAALCGIILKREVNGIPISKHVRFVAATNRRVDNANVSTILTPLLSRFHLVTTLEVEADEWQTWALKNNMPIELISFASFRPLLWNNQRLVRDTSGKESFVDIPATKEIENFACPRTIAALGNWMNAGVDSLEVWKGVVGEGFATEFASFYRTYKELAGLPESILLNPEKARLPDVGKADVRFALTGALVNMATEKNFDIILRYMARMQKEMQVFFMKAATARNDNLRETDTFITWSVENKAFTQ